MVCEAKTREERREKMWEVRKELKWEVGGEVSWEGDYEDTAVCTVLY